MLYGKGHTFYYLCVNPCCSDLYFLIFYRILTKLLEVSDDPQVLAVAAHDVGEYVRHYPRGKRYVQPMYWAPMLYSFSFHRHFVDEKNECILCQKNYVY